MNMTYNSKRRVLLLALITVCLLSMMCILSADVSETGKRIYHAEWTSIAAFVLIVGGCVYSGKKTNFAAPVAEKAELFGSTKGAGPIVRTHAIAAQISAVLLALLYFSLLLTSHVSRLSILTVFTLSVVTLILQLSYRIIHHDHDKPHQLFLCVTIILGLAMAYGMPLCSWLSWDDEFHFGRVYDFSHFALLDKTTPLAIHRMRDYSVTYPLVDYIKDPWQASNQILADMKVSVETWHRVDNPISVVGNLPSILTLMVMRVFGADIVKMMLLGRMAAVIAYAWIISAGIKRMKKGGYILSAVCLIPCALFLASAYSYDYWLTAWVAYAFAYFVSELQQPEKKIGKGDAVCMIGGMFLAGLVKQVYLFLYVPFLFLPDSKFEDKEKARKFRRNCIIFMVLLAVIFVLPMLIRQTDGSDTRGGAEVSSIGQIKYILKNPIAFMKTLFNFTADYLSAPLYTQFSTYFAYITINLGEVKAIWGTLSLLLLLYAAFTDCHNDTGLPNIGCVRRIGLLSCLIQILLIEASLYVAFTPVGLDTIAGCQYRYLFPVFIPLFYFITHKTLVCRVRESVQNAVVFGGLSFVIIGSFVSAYVSKL